MLGTRGKCGAHSTLWMILPKRSKIIVYGYYTSFLNFRWWFKIWNHFLKDLENSTVSHVFCQQVSRRKEKKRKETIQKGFHPFLRYEHTTFLYILYIFFVMPFNISRLRFYFPHHHLHCVLRLLRSSSFWIPLLCYHTNFLSFLLFQGNNYILFSYSLCLLLNTHTTI